jgi:hypothetical protein
MIKAIALGNNFLLTAIASSFLCWMASLHINSGCTGMIWLWFWAKA